MHCLCMYVGKRYWHHILLAKLKSSNLSICQSLFIFNFPPYIPSGIVVIIQGQWLCTFQHINLAIHEEGLRREIFRQSSRSWPVEQLEVFLLCVCYILFLCRHFLWIYKTISVRTRTALAVHQLCGCRSLLIDHVALSVDMAFAWCNVI